MGFLILHSVAVKFIVNYKIHEMHCRMKLHCHVVVVVSFPLVLLFFLQGSRSLCFEQCLYSSNISAFLVSICLFFAAYGQNNVFPLGYYTFAIRYFFLSSCCVISYILGISYLQPHYFDLKRVPKVLDGQGFMLTALVIEIRWSLIKVLI